MIPGGAPQSLLQVYPCLLCNINNNNSGNNIFEENVQDSQDETSNERRPHKSTNHFDILS